MDADPGRSATFRLLTIASAETVWRCLTCPARSPRYLHGLAVRAAWIPGARVELTADGRPPLSGRLLLVEPAEQLSLTLEDPSGTCTYLTWTLRTSEVGTVVRLQVDEVAGSSSTEDELEDVWLPVLNRLSDLLREDAVPG